MLKEVVPFTEHPYQRSSEPVLTLVEFFERKLGAHFYFDEEDILEPTRIKIFRIAEKLKDAGIIHTPHSARSYCDEPPIIYWSTTLDTPHKESAGGMSFYDDTHALICTLAEALERYLWYMEIDYFRESMTAPVGDMPGRRFLHPTVFAGFSDAQRSADPKLTLRDDAKYLWIAGRSIVNSDQVWLPAQSVSGYHGGNEARNPQGEPLILKPITTGLATGENDTAAILSGALEVIERDAFSITWLNQLSMPRVDTSVLLAEKGMRTILETCERYGLKTSFMLMATDAPTYAVLAYMEDNRGAPAVTVGMKAHPVLVDAARGALSEALRARHGIRMRMKHGEKPLKNPKRIRHLERLMYWAQGADPSKLSFLKEGPVVTAHADWEHDTKEVHLRRIADWCKTKKYDMVAVDLGKSKKNVTPWSVQMVVMPQLQPMHLDERYPAIGGVRLTEVPQVLGYEPRSEPYLDEPHPFA